MFDMKPAVTSAIITVIAIQLFGIMTFGLKGYLHDWGAVNFWGAVVSMLIGVVLVFWKTTLPYAKGILVASGIFLVIGFATCSMGM
jgi:hypothetical protein